MTIDADNEITFFFSLTKVAEGKLPGPLFIRIKSCLNDILRKISMSSYYGELMKTWAAGKILDAQSRLKKGKKEKLFNQEETEKLDRLVIDWGAIIVQECLKNPKVAYNLYENLQRLTRWDDEILTKQLNISIKSLKNVQNLKMSSRKVIENMVMALYRFLKII